jgi:hypothetical protein
MIHLKTINEGATQLITRYENGYGVSFIDYGGGENELAVIHFDENFGLEPFTLCWDTPITKDTLRNLSGEELASAFFNISLLDPK